MSTIVKGVKRAMAGEYSRELFAKVFAGQCRLIELGFRQGGPAGYGLRRVLIDQGGSVKSELARGEHKSLQTDRVILVPGPDSEVATVQRIYRWFIDDGRSESEIAARLNAEGSRTDLGRDWTRATVREVLTCASLSRTSAPGPGVCGSARGEHDLSPVGAGHRPRRQGPHRVGVPAPRLRWMSAAARRA